MRVKETADDYRLFPDPDLAPFDLDDEFIDRCRGEIPELPDAKRVRFEADFGIKAADAEQIAGDPEFADFFEAAAAGMAGKEAQTVANLLVNEMIAYLKGVGVSLAESVLHRLRWQPLPSCWRPMPSAPTRLTRSLRPWPRPVTTPTRSSTSVVCVR